MAFLPNLPRRWVTIGVPGTAGEHISTYVVYPSATRIEPPEAVEELDWLRHAARHPKSSLAAPSEFAVRDISIDAAADLVGGAALPADFHTFLAMGLRDRLRSATDCYFDLGHHAESVDGGKLLHLVSDSQWVYHWLLFLGERGETAVVGTRYPAGFELGADEQSMWRHQTQNYTIVAGSLGEFLWRWLMDNEIFYASVIEHHLLTAAQSEYLNALGPSQPLC